MNISSISNVESSRYVGVRQSDRNIASAATLGIFVGLLWLLGHQPLAVPTENRQNPSSLKTFDARAYPPPMPSSVGRPDFPAVDQAASGERKAPDDQSSAVDTAIQARTPQSSDFTSQPTAPSYTTAFLTRTSEAASSSLNAREDALGGASTTLHNGGRELERAKEASKPAYAGAIWIERPSSRDILRNWPSNVRGLTSVVTVLLRCRVRRNGRPHDCEIMDDGNADRGFAQASIRLASLGRVQPMLRDGKPSGLPVLIPFTFLPERTLVSASAKSISSKTRVATSCISVFRISSIRNTCEFPLDVAFCIETRGNTYSCNYDARDFGVSRMRIDAGALTEWPLELQRLRMKRSEKVAFIACRHEPADDVQPHLSSVDPAMGYCS